MTENLPSVEVKGFKVLTTRQIAEAYDTTITHIKQNFRTNKSRYIEGKHYIELKGEALAQFKNKVENFYLVGKTANTLYLWTEKGALLHAKSLNTDKAWKVYDYLVDYYFRAKEEVLLPKEDAPPAPPALPASTPAKEFEVPKMSNPILIFRVLLDIANSLNLSVDSFEFKATRSMLHGKRIGIRTGSTVEDAAYELAYELAHAMVHHDGGDLIRSPLSKDYTLHAERIANFVILALNTKMSHLLK